MKCWYLLNSNAETWSIIYCFRICNAMKFLTLFLFIHMLYIPTYEINEIKKFLKKKSVSNCIFIWYENEKKEILMSQVSTQNDKFLLWNLPSSRYAAVNLKGEKEWEKRKMKIAPNIKKITDVLFFNLLNINKLKSLYDMFVILYA